MVIAYLGPKGSFTEAAAKEHFPEEELQPIQSISKAVKAVEQGHAEFSVLPLENYYTGVIRPTLDALIESEKARIVGETFLKIEHCLGALPDHTEIIQIYSKEEAIEQCRKYLDKNYPDAETIAVESTSKAAALIKENRSVGAAAIASESALKENGLEILAYDLCPNNLTRFAIIGTKPTQRTGSDKTMLLVRPRADYPGVLRNVLGYFADQGINLEFIQSKPNGMEGYVFYFELKGHIDDEEVQRSLRMLKAYLIPFIRQNKEDGSIKIIGSYAEGRQKE